MAAAITQRRKVLKQQTTRLQTFLDTVDRDSITPVELQIRLEKLEEYYNQFNLVQIELEALCTDDLELETQEQEREAYEIRYFELKTKYRILLQHAEKRAVGEKQSISPVRQSTETADIKLPKLDLPIFSGNIQEWRSFHDLFSAIVHTNATLTPAQKLHYLKIALKDDASRLLASIPVTDANYPEAWKILMDRYNNERQIVFSHLKSLFCQPNQPTESATGLRKLLDTTVEHIRALHVLKQPTESWDTILVHLVVERLDSETRRQWELSSPSTTMPVFQELKDFLEQKCRALEAAGVQKPKHSGQTGNPNQRGIHSKSSSNFHVETRRACVICKLLHEVFNCPVFLQKSVEERHTIAKQHFLCFNCLRSGHLPRQCKSGTCKQCHGKHNSLLHFDRAQDSRPRNGSTEKQALTSFQNPKSAVLLYTAMIGVTDKSGNIQVCRALLDSGSQSSFITEDCIQRLGIARNKANISVHGIGQIGIGIARGTVHLHIKSLINEFTLHLEAIILPRITALLPSQPIDETQWMQLQDLQLADPTYHSPSYSDILLGADVFANVMIDGRITGRQGTPTAQNSVFGWVLSGKVDMHSSRAPPDSHCHITHTHHSNLDTEAALRNFWEIEEVTKTKIFTDEEVSCENHFSDTYSQDKDGRFVVRLPFRSTITDLGASRQTAVKRLYQQETALLKQEGRRQQYNEFLLEYIELNHMEPVPQTQIQHKSYYLSHHSVTKQDSSTTKLRVVFDGSAKSCSGLSLNDTLMVGPVIQDTLFNILLRFRFHRIALCADIEKMYRQIKVHPDDTDYQRILWRSTPDSAIQDYRLTTVTYGLACSPYLATRCLQQLARDKSEMMPDAAKAILQDFFVDDLMSGADSLEGALELQAKIISILEKGGFHLRKWSSNHPEVLSAVSTQDRELNLHIDPSMERSVKTLGLMWNTISDHFSFSVKPSQNTTTMTKRSILSDISRIFDPLGWLAPTIIVAKIMIQKLWLLGLAWDDDLPDETIQKWSQFCTQLQLLSGVSIPRSIHGPESTTTMQLHGFSDASEQAYAAVIYTRIKDSSGQIHIRLLASKTKVAPVKTISVPRLELCGASLLAKLIYNVKEAQTTNIVETFAWTDSTIVLSWISGRPIQWKTFVANRVSEIQTTLPPTCWNHVVSRDNPADCASRGLLPSQLLEHPLWWSGPKWLKLSSQEWPKSSWSSPEEALKEQRTIKHCLVNHEADNELLMRFSTLPKLLRITAYCLRFIKNCKVKASQRSGEFLTAADLQGSLRLWIRFVQAREFADTITALKSGQPLTKHTPFLNLNPFMDAEGLLRVGGRIRYAKISYDARFPVLLPKKHVFTDLVIVHEHLKQLHAGPQLLLAALNQRYWIVNGRSVVRQHIHKCIQCYRQRASTAHQLMSDLPAKRLEPLRPFLRCGVDYGGPLLVKWTKGRGKRHQKVYICLFVCFSTRAVHLELASDLTTDAFIGALKRFIGRRGKCLEIHSDNGTNFVGASRELAELQRLFRSQEHKQKVNNFLATEGISWKFIPPAAPHFGGIWEAGIKSVKQHLRRIVGTNILTYEEMNTLLVQIEACLNSRPLTSMSTDPSDFSALTPGHFLTGGALTSIPEPDLTHLQLNHLSRWQLMQRLTQQFWSRWKREYLSRLQQRPKWSTGQNPVKLGDLALLKDEQSPPLRWNLARVVQLHPGKDNVVRVVTVKTANGQYKRPIVKLCILPCN